MNHGHSLVLGPLSPLGIIVILAVIAIGAAMLFTGPLSNHDRENSILDPNRPPEEPTR